MLFGLCHMISTSVSSDVSPQAFWNMERARAHGPGQFINYINMVTGLCSSRIASNYQHITAVLYYSHFLPPCLDLPTQNLKNKRFSFGDAVRAKSAIRCPPIGFTWLSDPLLSRFIVCCREMCVFPLRPPQIA